MSIKRGQLKGKKVLILGLGLHGGGKSVARYCLRSGAKIRISDLKPRKTFSAVLKGMPSISGTFGSERLADVAWADIIIKNPGIPSDSKMLQYARKLGKPIESDLSLFYKILGRKPDCAVTGTRGKSTTTAMIGWILGDKAVVCGNNRVPVLSVADARRKKIILELSSWQIEDALHAGVSPRVAVLTNVLVDHLNRYRSWRQYEKAKESLFAYQTKHDYAIFPYTARYIKKASRITRAMIYYVSEKKLPEKFNGAYLSQNSIYLKMKSIKKKIVAGKDMRIPGKHNLKNAMFAALASHLMGEEVRRIQKRIKTFPGLYGRIQITKKKRGAVYINDTTATSPDALSASLQTVRACYPKHSLFVIAGGADKKLNFSLLRKLPRDPKITFYWLQGTATEQMMRNTKQFTQKGIYSSLESAFKNALRNRPKDCVILFSPGAASFGMFLHEFDRGQAFDHLVQRV